MPMLDAALAFALTMMALASITTLIVELIHRCFKLRASGMKKLLEKLFENEVVPRLTTKTADVRQAAKQKFLAEMLRNPLVEKETLQPALRSVESLTKEEFWHRLGATDLGKQLRAMKAAKMAEFEKETDYLSNKFDEYSRAATDYFDRRAKLFSLVIGGFLALCINANAFHIWDAYLTNPSMAQAVIDRSEEYEAMLEDATKRAEERSEETTLKELETYQKEIRSLIQEVDSQGLPIGYDDPTQNWWKFRGWELLRALFGFVLTGCLFGLGGPFWFRIVTRLGEVRRTVTGGIRPRSFEPSMTLAERSRLLEQGAAKDSSKDLSTDSDSV